MMLVKILGFGSNWWARFGRDPQDRYRFTRHAAYFNSTGVRCGNKIRRLLDCARIDSLQRRGRLQSSVSEPRSRQDLRMR